MSSRMLRGGAPAAIREVVVMFTTQPPAPRLSRLLARPHALAQLEKRTRRIPCSIHGRTTTWGDAVRVILGFFRTTKWAVRDFIRAASGSHVGVTSILADTRRLFERIQTFAPSWRLAHVIRFIDGEFARYTPLPVAVALYVFGALRFMCGGGMSAESRTSFIGACDEWIIQLFGLIEDTLGSNIRLPKPGMGNPEWAPPSKMPHDLSGLDPAIVGVLHDAVVTVQQTRSKRKSMSPITRLIHLVFSQSYDTDVATELMDIIDADETMRSAMSQVNAATAVRCVATQAHPYIRVALFVASACAIASSATEEQWRRLVEDPVGCARGIIGSSAAVVIADTQAAIHQLTEGHIALLDFRRMSGVSTTGYYRGIDTFWESVMSASGSRSPIDRETTKVMRGLFDNAHLLSGRAAPTGFDARLPEEVVVPPMALLIGVPHSLRATVRSVWRIIAIALLSSRVTQVGTWRADWACAMEPLINHFKDPLSRPRASGFGFKRNPRVGPVLHALATTFVQWRTIFSVQLPSVVRNAQLKSLRGRYRAIGCDVLPFADTVYVCMQCVHMYRACVPMPREVVAPSNRDAAIYGALRKYRVHNTRQTDGCAPGAYTCASLDVCTKPVILCGKCTPRSRAPSRAEVVSDAQLESCSALGRMVCVDGRFYTLCANESCGVVCEFAPRRSVVITGRKGEAVIVCHSCVTRCAIHDQQYMTQKANLRGLL